ncbi:MAG TPA: SufS family cysteine desulfurase [Verrucomicrobiae bacterium]|nr:SufS family cysteine desulfurase [Verrucomicrobiae bacterium]
MTTAPNNDAALATDKSAHSDLVKQLFTEALTQFSGAAKSPTVLPNAPKEIFTVPNLPSTDAPSAVPPVHPSAPPAAPKLAKPEKTPSGAHVPASGDSYAFGEPRCNGSYTLQSRKPEKTANTNPLLGLPDAESIAAPEFYFLRTSDISHQLPAAYQTYPKNTAPIPKFDIAGVRRDFPALHQLINGKPLIWLDNAATTHKPQAVIDATSQFYGRDNSNIHRAAHTLAARSTELFEAGREKVRKFLGAGDAKEIVFVRGTTEAINLVTQSYGRKNIGAGDEIIVSELEHHANIVPWQLLAEQVGATLRVIPINDRGELILDEFAKLLSGKTKFVSVAHVSNSLGTVVPVEQIIALAHARGVPVLIDGAQSTPHLPVNVTALDADFYVFSGHKIFGPTGIGALYGKAALLEAMPPWQGGGHMIKDVRFEKTIYQNAPEKFEAGTPDIAGVVGLGAAIDYLFKVGIPAIAAYEHALLEYAQSALATIPGLRPIGTALNKASVLSFVIPGIPNEQIAKHLDKHGIAVRAGHHCAQPAIRHFGLESSVRPSLAFYNTRDEIDTLVRALHSLKRN